jgi:hypothetical protein
VVKIDSDAEGVEQFAARWLLAFSERMDNRRQRRATLISFALPDAIKFVAFSDLKSVRGSKPSHKTSCFYVRRIVTI